MPSQAPTGVVTKACARPVRATLERLRAVVEERGLMVFTLVTTAARRPRWACPCPIPSCSSSAARPGDPIMLAAPLAALDLPLKVLVWENPAGGSFVSYVDPAYLGRATSKPLPRTGRPGLPAGGRAAPR
jgi:uncharacterized protein (DUF302 family)